MDNIEGVCGTHIYLYAKRIYKWSENIIEDLKKVLGATYLLEVSLITDEEVVRAITSFTIMTLIDYNKSSMIKDIIPIFEFKEQINIFDYRVKILENCLQKLRFIKVENLGKPNVTILPVNQN